MDIYDFLHYSCNIGTCDLPDMYAQSPRAKGIHIRQITSAYVTTITNTSFATQKDSTLAMCPNINSLC